MRDAFCRSLIARANRGNLVFLTGDLGFMALEPLRAALEDRFINAGIAEQNMLGVAAGLAHEGHEVWVYSIAPFCYARAFEQIRNDVCLHKLPVKIVGNGGGYGYGVMGATHYALEDYGALTTLPHLRAYCPVFDEDVAAVVQVACDWDGPSYIRLGRDESLDGHPRPPYTGWRNLLTGTKGVIVAIGPMAGALMKGLEDLSPGARPALWAIAEIPIACSPPPPDFIDQLRGSRKLIVVEEHVAQGGVGPQLCQWLMMDGLALTLYRHFHADNRPCGQYGSQQYMRRAVGLTTERILSCLSSPN